MHYAFFDVDGTVIELTSMLSFLAHVERTVGAAPTLGQLGWKAARCLQRLLPRSVLNRCYYRNFQGRNAAHVEALGRAWFADLLQSEPRLFKENVVARLRSHQAAGDEVVFVSGGFEACLRPIADHLGVRQILCARPEVRQGTYTGALLPPQTIGAGKARAITEFLRNKGAPASACIAAYGDHHSDLPMLRMAQQRYAVRGDPVLEQVAQQNHWTIL